jgi:hypothetical protein
MSLIFRWHPLPVVWYVVCFVFCYFSMWVVKKESKAVPLCHAGAKGERTYSFYSFLTSALDGEWSSSCPGRALPQVDIG